MKISAFTLLLTAMLVALSARADEQVRRVQEELRKRNLYFGEVDGRKTPETLSAIRSYQARKGFASTGEPTPETLRSLNLAAPIKPVEPWPEVPVLRSDVARDLAESDRKLLEELGEKTLIPVGEAPSEPADAEPESEPAEVPPDSDFAAKAHAFVADYLVACETNQLASEMKFYADRLNYFDHGKVDREFVARDVRRFYQRWPERHYDLLDFKMSPVKGGGHEVTFRIAFKYKSPAHSVAGRTVNRFKIQEDAGGLHFTEMKEQRVRE